MASADALDNFVATQVAAAAPESPYQEFPKTRLSRVVEPYIPTGSFKALREQGKLSDPNTMSEKAMFIMKTKNARVPGYTGFQRGKQHVMGRTFGDTTRHVYHTSFDELVRKSPIPSGPQANRKIQQLHLKDTFVSNNLSAKNHIPGYTGYVHGHQDCFGKTYGKITTEQLKKFAAENPRDDAVYAADGFADTMKPRHLQKLTSAPLPGIIKMQVPVLQIEKHFNVLTYQG
jgi:hypothetical protein